MIRKSPLQELSMDEFPNETKVVPLLGREGITMFYDDEMTYWCVREQLWAQHWRID